MSGRDESGVGATATGGGPAKVGAALLHPSLFALVATATVAGASFDERLPLTVIITNTGVVRSAISGPDLADVVTAALTADTTAAPDFVDGAVSECRNDLGCLIAERRLSGASGPVAALWLSLRATEESTKIIVNLLDVPLTATTTAPPNTAPPATRLGEPIVVRETDGDADRIIAAAIRRDVAPVLQARGYRDFEALRIDNLPAEGWIDIDGRRQRLTVEAPAVRGLQPKVRRVVIEPDGFEPVSMELAVEMDRTIRLNPDWQRQSTPAHVARGITWVGGGVLAASSVVAVLVAGTQHRTLCISADGSVPCGPTLAYEASWLLGMAGAGAAMSVGAYWVGDDYDWPWVSWLMGAATFALVTTTIELAR